MADAMAKSKLFGVKNVDEGMALMLVAQAEGYHPAIAVRDYHVIQGKPALKADAMLARFQASGGKVKWLSLTDEKVAAEFSHPSGGNVTIDWDMARAKRAQLGSNGMWNKFPRQMLRARVISEGIRTVFPGVIVGAYTPEEVSDFQGQTIDGQATEVKPPDLSIHSPDGMSQADKKALYAEAEAELEKVDSFDDLANWLQKFHMRLTKNIAKAHVEKLEAKAAAIEAALKEREAKGKIND
jgi:hypothetical protein